MKRIGIITAFDTQNYGNRLQNLAVQTILDNRGLYAETIVCKSRSRMRFFIHRATILFRSRIQKKPLSKRISAFYDFNRKYLKIKYYYNKDYKLPASVREQYDFFSTGSDQVWNYRFIKKPWLSMNLLSFAYDRQKICISPSIGASTIDDSYVEFYKNALMGFRYLSCREKQGAAEIERVTGKKCEWLIDPTLCVSADEWRKMLSISDSEKSVPYIFAFFLDGMSSALNDFIKEYASSRYRIVNPSDPSSPYYSIGPNEFVSLLANAHMVFTDSFHVTAFSINFHVPFFVFDRILLTKMSSRIESMCELFHVEDRYIRKQEAFTVVETCDFEEADRQLVIERKRFYDYLDKCLQA